MKANHNYEEHKEELEQVFINKSKIHFESKSQPYYLAPTVKKWCLSISQRYILKANHNEREGVISFETGVYQ